jgi:hypothetical protein
VGGEQVLVWPSSRYENLLGTSQLRIGYEHPIYYVGNTRYPNRDAEEGEAKDREATVEVDGALALSVCITRAPVDGAGDADSGADGGAAKVVAPVVRQTAPGAVASGDDQVSATVLRKVAPGVDGVDGADDPGEAEVVGGLTLPLLVEFDSGEKSTREVAAQMFPYVGLGHSGAPRKRFPDFRAIEGYALPVLFLTQPGEVRNQRAGREVSLVPRMTSRGGEEGERKDHRRIENVMGKLLDHLGRVRWKAEAPMPPILMGAHADLYDKGWEMEVWCAHLLDDDGRPRRVPLWRAMMAAARPLLAAQAAEAGSVPEAGAVLRLDLKGAPPKARQRRMGQEGRAKMLAHKEARQREQAGIKRSIALTREREKDRANAVSEARSGT